MPRYDDRHGGGSRLYVGHLSSRTRTRDLEDLFSRYGRVRDVDMKRDFAFIDFSDPRDADDARYSLNGRDLDGSRITVEFSKGVPRGRGGTRDFGGRGPIPGSGRCFNCGVDGHWARDCKSGDWKNKCYRCGDRGHIERNCQNSPKKIKRGRSYSRSPSPRHGRSRSRSYSRSRSPTKRTRVSRSPVRSRSPRRHKASPPVSRGRNHTNGSGYGRSRSPVGRSISPVDRSRSPIEEVVKESPMKANGSPSPTPRKESNAREDDEVVSE